MTKRILIAGAGAAGQVFGHHLALGGADVTVLVRPHHEDGARRGFRMVRVGLTGGRRASAFTPLVLTSVDAAARAERFDQTWLCVATNALDDRWLADVAAATAPSTLVSFQPGLGVRERLLRAAPSDRVAQGVIAFLAWATPLPGSDDPREVAAEGAPGTAYLVPPLEPIVVSGGSERRVLDVVDALRAGGLASHIVRDAEADLAFSTALLMPMVAALEIAGWSFATFRKSEVAELASRSASQTLAVAEAETGRPPPWFASAFLAAPLLRLGALVAPLVAPLDLETYLRVHFTKVGEQTRLLLAGYGERARARGLSYDAIEAIVRGLEDTPQRP